MSTENRWLLVAIIGVVGLIVLLFSVKISPAMEFHAAHLLG